MTASMIRMSNKTVKENDDYIFEATDIILAILTMIIILIVFTVGIPNIKRGAIKHYGN